MGRGGYRANSGRKPILSELTVKEICDKASNILLRWLDSTEVSDDKKVAVCAEFIKRRIPNAVEVDGDGIINAITVTHVITNGLKPDIIAPSKTEGSIRVEGPVPRIECREAMGQDDTGSK